MPQNRPKRKPKSPAPPSRKERPVAPQPKATGDMPPDSKPTWSLSHLDADHDGSWSWNHSTPATLRQLADFLRHMEELTWAQLQTHTYSGARSGTHRKNKLVSVESLCGEAQRRLRDLRLDHLDELFEFRIGSKPRLWGFPRNGVFHVIWWDPEHQVYPVDPP